MSSSDIADSIRRIVAVRDGQTGTVGYEQSGMSYQNPQDAPWEARPNVDGKRGIGLASATGTGGGIASPLTEGSVDDREYYGLQLVTSADGLFVLPISPIKKLKLSDANGNPVEIVLAEPKPQP